MPNVPQDLRYTEEHEWVRASDDEGIVEIGITEYAQGGNVIFVELPKVGESFERMQVFGTIEAVKAVLELFSPVTGEVVEVNDALNAEPLAVNRDAYGEGWLVRMRLAEGQAMESLMDAASYTSYIGEG